jgi:hypothetical protein
LIVFRDGPAGRRARLIGGPDVWEAAFPEEISNWIDRAEAEATEAEQRWQREQELLGR